MKTFPKQPFFSNCVIKYKHRLLRRVRIPKYCSPRNTFGHFAQKKGTPAGGLLVIAFDVTNEFENKEVGGTSLKGKVWFMFVNNGLQVALLRLHYLVSAQAHANGKAGSRNSRWSWPWLREYRCIIIWPPQPNLKPYHDGIIKTKWQEKTNFGCYVKLY